tara:strand:- start:88 stop:501 length:414 start_codon:yes stop_codon:yes gene_type:complete
MKKLIVILTLITSSAFSQITIKGRVIRIENCVFTDIGCMRLDYIQPSETFFHFTDTEFFTRGTINTGMYKLFDKDTTGFEKDRIISYMANRNKDLYMIAIRESQDDPAQLLIAVFPFDGKVEYKQYIVKIKIPKINK